MNKNLLDIYSDCLIAQNGYATATGLSQMLDGQVSHDKITRFLNGVEYSSKELLEYVKPNIGKIEETTGDVLILDDSIEEKPYTDENELILWHYCKRQVKPYFNQSGLTVKKCYFKEPTQSYKFQEIKNTKSTNIKIKYRNIIFEIDSDFNEAVLKRFIKVLKSC